MTMPKAKPFIKWVGGKGQLLEQLENLLPADFWKWRDATYIEPFVGGGAMLFHMLQRHPNIRHAVINDINHDLVVCYQTVRDNVEELIPSVRDIEQRYLAQPDMDAKREMFMEIRSRYNKKDLDPIENTTLFFFLNRTCFNGLYRVNKKGEFNVPCGKYLTPQICDEATLRTDSELLKRVEILEGDFAQTLDHTLGTPTLFYFDPPYRPLSDTSSFNDYTKEAFNDDSQVRLKEFCDKVNDAGYLFMLSNSDCKGKDEKDNFFDILYEAYHINRVMASRNVNANGAKRGKITEILVHNYSETADSHMRLNFEPAEDPTLQNAYA